MRRIEAAAAADQAAGLRRLFTPPPPRVLPVLGDASGATTANLAAALARTGDAVLVVDATRGEIARAFGARPRFELAHVLAGDRHLSRVLLEAAAGVHFVPAARALPELARAGASLLDCLRAARPRPDVVLVHRPEAASWRRLAEARAPALVAADAARPAAAFAALRLACMGASRAMLLVEPGPSEVEALEVHGRLALAAGRTLGVRLPFAGFLPEDDAWRLARRVARPVFDVDARAASALAFLRAAALAAAHADTAQETYRWAHP